VTTPGRVGKGDGVPQHGAERVATLQRAPRLRHEVGLGHFGREHERDVRRDPARLWIVAGAEPLDPAAIAVRENRIGDDGELASAPILRFPS
jgi:hypothetical protein